MGETVKLDPSLPPFHAPAPSLLTKFGLSWGLPWAIRFFRQAHFMFKTASMMASDDPTVDVPVPSDRVTHDIRIVHKKRLVQNKRVVQEDQGMAESLALDS